MNCHMFAPRQRLKVLWPIIHRVPVDVMDHHTARPRTIGLFPHDDGSLAPDVRFCNLDPRTSITPPLVSHASGDTTDRQHVDRVHAFGELCRRGAVLAFVDVVKLVVEGGRASDRATVRRTYLGRLTGERSAANGARQVNWHTHSVPSFAGTGTTLAVAHLHGRDAIGIDIDERNKAMYPARLDEVRRTLFGTKPEIKGQEVLF
tara:strand:- start:4 stop:615 length:612 start_codon:yes stop_codon:yes gene_type:complete